MRRALALALAAAGVMIAACTTTTTVITEPPPGGGGNGNGNVTPKPAEEEEDPAKQPPHSLGVIVLGESHASGSSTSQPIVSASFFPDAKMTKRCTTPMGACEVTKTAKCTKVKTSTTGCDTGEYCTWDESCAAVCKKAPACRTTCKTDEVCKVDDAGKSACVKKEIFDAGPLAFSGTTTAITLFPPYAYESKATGAPFLAGADLEVQAQGATNAGFEAFKDKFTATTFIQTNPPLNKVNGDLVFGTGALPIAWAPGKDRVYVNLGGMGGSASCKAVDADGKLDVPREVIDAVIGDVPEGSRPSLSISVTRSRKEVKKDKRAKGELTGVQVIPEGWVELTTVSTESQSFQGCAAGQNSCGSECVDLKTSTDHCGRCDNACQSGQTCSAGKCVSDGQGCDACVQSALQGACASQYQACTANSACSALLSCVNQCTTQACVTTCQQQNPGGVSLFNPVVSCVNTQCSAECN